MISVTDVVITGSERLAPQDLPITIGDDLLATDLNSVVDSLSRLPWLASVKVYYDLQRRLVVDVVEKAPVCYIYSDGIYGATAQGELLSATAVNESLPIVRGLELRNPRPHQQPAHAGLHAALKLFAVINSRSPAFTEQISELVVHESGVSLVLEPGTIRACFGWGGFEQKVDRLELVLTRKRSERLTIDLRFHDITILQNGSENREVGNGV
jgi:hypothetical protein